MRFEETLNEGMRRGYQLALTGQEVEELIDKKVDELVKSAALPGFRPGKVPPKIFKASQGNRIRQMVTLDCVKSEMEKHFEDSGNAPMGEPALKLDDRVGDDAGFQCEMSYELFPTVPEVEFNKEIQLVRPVIDDPESVIEGRIKSWARARDKYEETDADYSAEALDQVACAIAVLKDGSPLEGIEQDELKVFADPDAPEESIERRCFGAAAGQEFIIPGVPMPVEGIDPGDGEFDKLESRASVKSVMRRIPFELNDANAEEHGFGDLESLRSAFGEGVTRELSRMSDRIVRVRLFDHLEKILDFDLPPTVWDNETESILRALHGSESAGDETAPEESQDAESEDQPVQAGPPEPRDSSEEGGGEVSDDSGEDEKRAEARNLAARRLRIGFLITEFIKQKNLKTEFTIQEMGDWVRENVASQWDRQAALYRLREYEAFRRQIAGQLAEDQAADFMLSLISVTEEKVSLEELTKFESED